MERSYLPKGEHLRFGTTLNTVDQNVTNEVLLFPIRSDDFRKALEATGFQDIVFYHDFSAEPFDKAASFALVATAKKG